MFSSSHLNSAAAKADMVEDKADKQPDAKNANTAANESRVKGDVQLTSKKQVEATKATGLVAGTESSSAPRTQAKTNAPTDRLGPMATPY
ncbi:hypothetical protein FGB62_332g07 [Gracilaria domingensis]|nr:hypothetical protein FGB62_367g06 [Gracilaria domingensis]KAI0557199.1 hypothetical protein FGB62_332g07 [Gracilaria domingensis]